MFKLVVLLAALSGGHGNPGQPVDSTVDYARMCIQRDGGEECREAWAATKDQVCWCADTQWGLYCSCRSPDDMDDAEKLEFFIYRGKPTEEQL